MNKKQKGDLSVIELRISEVLTRNIQVIKLLEESKAVLRASLERILSLDKRETRKDPTLRRRKKGKKGKKK